MKLWIRLLSMMVSLALGITGVVLIAPVSQASTTLTTFTLAPVGEVQFLNAEGQIVAHSPFPGVEITDGSGTFLLVDDNGQDVRVSVQNAAATSTTLTLQAQGNNDKSGESHLFAATGSNWASYATPVVQTEKSKWVQFVGWAVANPPVQQQSLVGKCTAVNRMKVKRSGTTLILPKRCMTDAGQKVTVKVNAKKANKKVTGKLVKVKNVSKNQKKQKLKAGKNLITFGKKIKLELIYRAPAIDDYAAFDLHKHYKLK